MSLDRERVIAALPNYDVGEEVGRGGWAIVLRASHRILDRQVAVKLLPVAFGADPVVRARFIEEARLVAKLDHPHIAPVYDFVENEGAYIILMEYLAGGTLWDRFQVHGIRPDEACAYVLVAASALDHAHDRGILHRDIKPENLLFDDRPGVVKLGDFGIAKVIGAAAAGLTTTGQVVGTPVYMAPEQILGDPVSPATDVYACGTMLYEFLTGKLPFPDDDDVMKQMTTKITTEPTPIQDVRADVGEALGSVVMRSIEKRPDDRYATAAEFGEALAVGATRAFGIGWLRKSGIRLDSSSELTMITERSQGVAGRTTDVRGAMHATTSHMRLGDMMKELRAELDAAAAKEDAKEAAAKQAAPPAAPAPAAVGPVAAGPGAGWFADPYGRAEMRFWDGAAWTAWASTGGTVRSDPL